MEWSAYCKAVAALACLALSGCQLDNRVEVSARNGQVIFKTYWNRLAGDRPASVERLQVTELAQPRRPVWEVESIAINGRELKELQFGRMPTGFREKVKPQRLKVGQLHRVTLFALGGMDVAYFTVAPHELSREITVLHQ